MIGLSSMRARLALLRLSAAALPAAAGNLVANPGFERLVEDGPFGWQTYVGPQEKDGGGGGAVAAADHRAFAGEACVRLHTPVPYAKDPANNWSQNILADLAGKTVTLSAMARTEDATDAAIWLQCWRKKPWGVLRVARSDETTPLHGTNDWTPVHLEVEVPDGTDFVTVRLVLKGAGTAWFDEVSLARNEESAAPAEAKPSAPDAEPVAAEKPEAAPVAEVTPATGETESAPEAGDTPAMRDTAADTATELEALKEELRQLHDLNAHLEDALDGTSEDNNLLLQDMLMLQESLDEMENRQRSLLRPFVGEGQFAPPLVPKGEDWRHLL